MESRVVKVQERNSMSDGTTGPRADSATRVPEVPTEREIRLVFVGLAIVLGLGAIDQSVVATALPRILNDLGGITDLSWVVTAYVLSSTSVMPLYGKLSDQYGRKPVLSAAILIFLLGSFLSGVSSSLLQLIIFRAIQGLGAGGLLPLAQIIIGDLVPPAERGRRQGAIVAVFAICSITGPVIGGLITDALSWHWIFFINLPLGGLSLVVIAKVLHPRTPLRSRRIDYIGALLLTASTTALLLVLALGGSTWPWVSLQIGTASIAAVLLGLFFALHIRKTPEAVIPPLLFQNQLFLVACAVLTLTFMAMLGASLFFPLFFQLVEGVSPSHSGFLTGPLMIGVVISSVFNGRVLLRYGRYKPAQIVGLILAITSFSVLAWAVATARPLAVIEPAIFVLGLGLGFVMPNMTIAVQNGLPAEHRGVGTATLAFFRSFGGLIGVAGAGAILSAQLHRSATAGAVGASSMLPKGASLLGLTPADQASLVEIYRHAIATVFTTGVCVMAFAILAIIFLPELPLVPRPIPRRDRTDADRGERKRQRETPD
jgi:EmrB/QacA subfamily drug resistance transporter